AEGEVVQLPREDVEALHERQARVDHGRELAREDDQVLLPDAAAEGRNLELEGERLLADLEVYQRHRAEARGHLALVGGLHLSTADLARPGLPFPRPDGKLLLRDRAGL